MINLPWMIPIYDDGAAADGAFFIMDELVKHNH